MSEGGARGSVYSDEELEGFPVETQKIFRALELENWELKKAQRAERGKGEIEWVKPKMRKAYVSIVCGHEVKYYAMNDSWRCEECRESYANRGLRDSLIVERTVLNE